MPFMPSPLDDASRSFKVNQICSASGREARAPAERHEPVDAVRDDGNSVT